MSWHIAPVGRCTTLTFFWFQQPYPVIRPGKTRHSPALFDEVIDNDRSSVTERFTWNCRFETGFRSAKQWAFVDGLISCQARSKRWKKSHSRLFAPETKRTFFLSLFTEPAGDRCDVSLTGSTESTYWSGRSMESFHWKLIIIQKQQWIGSTDNADWLRVGFAQCKSQSNNLRLPTNRLHCRLCGHPTMDARSQRGLLKFCCSFRFHYDRFARQPKEAIVFFPNAMSGKRFSVRVRLVRSAKQAANESNWLDHRFWRSTFFTINHASRRKSNRQLSSIKECSGLHNVPHWMWRFYSILITQTVRVF